MSMPSYLSPDVQLYQNIMRDFIRMSVKAGKTKMIFDLRGNGGGNAILGHDSFKQVFPQADQQPFGGTRFRANDALNVVGQITRDFNANKTFVQKNPTQFKAAFGQLSMNDVFLFTSGFSFQHQLDINDKAFGSWEEMFGPETVNADKFTSTLRYNFSDEASYTYAGFSVIGFLKNANETKTPQPFKAQDIVMVSHSNIVCDSKLIRNSSMTACAPQPAPSSLSSSRTKAASAPSQWGANPSSAPCKASAAPKEHNPLPTATSNSALRSFTRKFPCRLPPPDRISDSSPSLGSPEQQAQWNTTSLGKTAFAEQMFKRTAYSGGNPAGGINLKDNLRRGDPSKTPLEFIYEAADCRMFYTAPMINDVTMVWKGVVDRMFRNGTAKCVQGSTGDKSSISGGGQSKAGSVPPPMRAGVDQSKGAGSTWGMSNARWLSIAAAIGLSVYL